MYGTRGAANGRGSVYAEVAQGPRILEGSCEPLRVSPSPEEHLPGGSGGLLGDGALEGP